MSNPKVSFPGQAGPSRRGADPSLREPSTNGLPPNGPLRRFGWRKWLGPLLYALFWVVLLLPRLRRLRRGPHWNRVRWVMGWVGAGFVLGGWLLAKLWLAIAGGIAVLAALAIRRAKDPDHERKLQARHKADYLLNGGVLVHRSLPGSISLDRRQPLYLLIRGPELLVVPVAGPGDVESTIDITQIADIRVAGQTYRPIYVSEAKDPPVREASVLTGRTTELELTLEGGRTLRFEYQGAFSKHLAETAAHAVYSVRNLIRQEAESGDSEALFQIVG